MYFSQQLYVNYDKKIIVGKNQFFSEKKEDIFDNTYRPPINSYLKTIVAPLVGLEKF